MTTQSVIQDMNNGGNNGSRKYALFVIFFVLKYHGGTETRFRSVPETLGS